LQDVIPKSSFVCVCVCVCACVRVRARAFFFLIGGWHDMKVNCEFRKVSLPCACHERHTGVKKSLWLHSFWISAIVRGEGLAYTLVVLPPGKIWYSLNRRLDGLQSRSRHFGEENTLCPCQVWTLDCAPLNLVLYTGCSLPVSKHCSAGRFKFLYYSKMIDIEGVENNLLQAILVVGDATAREGKTASSKSKPEQSQQMHLSSTSGGSNKTPISSSSGGELSISHILGTSDILGSSDDPLLDLG